MPSLPICESDNSFPHRLTDMYRRGQEHIPMWTCSASMQASTPARMPVRPASTTMPSTPAFGFAGVLPLHAPVPVPGQSSLLFDDYQNYRYPTPQSAQMSHQSSAVSRSICDPQIGFMDLSQYAAEPLQPTFPTPSEMLAELAVKESTQTDDQLSEKKSETARKARMRAMTKSVGFTPTDPFVSSFGLFYTAY